MKTTNKLTIAMAASLLALSVQATPVTYDFTLTATGFGTVSPVFGIAGLPAGPFHGSFSLNEPLTPNATLTPVVLTAFSTTIGSATWTLADVTHSNFSTDATGRIDPTKFLIEAVHGLAGDREVLSITSTLYGNLSWFAVDATGSCGFAISPDPLVGPVSGTCIGGGPRAFTVTEHVQGIPEPATLLLTLCGLLGLATRRRA